MSAPDLNKQALDKAMAQLAIANAEADRCRALVDEDEARALAKTLLGIARAKHTVSGGNYLSSTHDIWLGNEGAATAESEAVLTLTVDCLNETLDRIAYAIDNPDAALSFTEDGTPRLSARDDSGVDHEFLFKMGRVAR